jgi:hypothetical protein
VEEIFYFSITAAALRKDFYGGKDYDERIKVHKTIFQSSRNINEVDGENPH